MNETNELSFPFNAVEDDLGQPDRLYDAENFANYFSAFIGNGVYPNPSSNLQTLSIYENMVVNVGVGKAFINGYFYDLTENADITINPSNIAYNRCDNLVIQLNLTERLVRLVYKPGVATNSPIAPEVVRNADIFELKIAEIFVPSGAVKIRQQDIIDTRINNAVCGVVHHVIQDIDTTSLFNQYKDYLDANIIYWDKTKLQQSSDWQEQMYQQFEDWSNQTDGQQTLWDEDLKVRKNNFDTWFLSSKIDITTLQSFDFENWLELKGAKYTEIKDNDNVWVSTIAINTKIIAIKKDYPKNQFGEFITNITVYDEFGAIMKETNCKEYKNSQGNYIKEVY